MKKRPAKNSPSRNQYTVVLEDIHGQFKVFGERLITLDKKVDVGFKDLHGKLDSHTQMIGQLMIDMEEVKYELKKRPTFDDLKTIEKRLARLEAKI